VILVFNASPLIVLAKAGLLEPVTSLPARFIVPQPVAIEIGACRDLTDPARVWLGDASHSTLIAEAPQPDDFILAWGLGAGESSVLALTQSLSGSIAVLDDLAARRCAGSLGLKVTGTLGLLLMAKKSGSLQSISSALDAIVDAGLFISPRHLADVRKLAGE
jgi:predicted nucleic acid-binding protein